MSKSINEYTNQKLIVFLQKSKILTKCVWICFTFAKDMTLAKLCNKTCSLTFPFFLTFAMKSIPFISFITRAEIASQRVCAVSEHVARAILALVVVWHVAAFAAEAVVAVALRVQTRAVFALVTGGVEAIA